LLAYARLLASMGMGKAWEPITFRPLPLIARHLLVWAAAYLRQLPGASPACGDAVGRQVTMSAVGGPAAEGGDGGSGRLRVST
jgi:hypothetical protein